MEDCALHTVKYAAGAEDEEDEYSNATLHGDEEFDENDLKLEKMMVLETVGNNDEKPFTENLE